MKKNYKIIFLNYRLRLRKMGLTFWLLIIYSLDLYFLRVIILLSVSWMHVFYHQIDVVCTIKMNQTKAFLVLDQNKTCLYLFCLFSCFCFCCVCVCVCLFSIYINGHLHILDMCALISVRFYVCMCAHMSLRLTV